MSIHINLSLRPSSPHLEQILRLKLVRIVSQQFEIGHAKQTDAGSKHVEVGQTGEGGVSTGRAALNCDATAVNLAEFRELGDGLARVVRVDDAPVAL